MKRLWVGVLITFLFVGMGHRDAAIAQDKQNGEEVRFKWAFGALKGGEGGPQLVAINRDTSLRTGDELKMLLELTDECYAYVIYQGPKGEIRLLFPYELSDLEKGPPEAGTHFIPKGGGWFELDNQVGEETFHLLASAERLMTLEKLLKDYDSADSEDKPAFSRELLKEIQQLRRAHRSLKAPAERPVQIVGRIRGSGETRAANRPDIEPLAIEISAEGIYARTFTIDHK